MREYNIISAITTIETPRAEKWTTMSAVRRGGRKNCGGARRPEEDHREKN